MTNFKVKLDGGYKTVTANHFKIEEGGTLVFYKPLEEETLGTNKEKRYLAYSDWDSVKRL